MTLLKDIMPSENRKPEPCTIENCIEGYNKFVGKIAKSDIAGDHCFFGSNNQFRITYYKPDIKKPFYFRVKTHRMWFYCNEEVIDMAEDHENYTASHLCHTNGCINPKHLVLESLAVNKSRNVCPAGDKCWHWPRCLRPGHQISDNDVVFWNGNKMSKQ